jgi:hypothetical protein
MQCRLWHDYASKAAFFVTRLGFLSTCRLCKHGPETLQHFSDICTGIAHVLAKWSGTADSPNLKMLMSGNCAMNEWASVAQLAFEIERECQKLEPEW